jgi:hypothetical protein
MIRYSQFYKESLECDKYNIDFIFVQTRHACERKKMIDLLDINFKDTHTGVNIFIQ